MPADHDIARYRSWYRNLLRCYSKPYYDRFGQSMEQTFHDLCRERAAAGAGLHGLVLWMFVETSAGILRENGVSVLMKNNLVRIVLVVGLLLLVPLLGNMFVEGCNWGLFDFVFAGIILFGVGLTLDFLARKSGNMAYRLAVALACLTGFFLFWVNAAVGVIGDEDLANAMFLGVLVIPFVGALVARFEPRGMSRALVATAIAQAAVPLVALTWVSEENFAPGVLPVLGLNGVFVAAWLVAALLFRRALPPCCGTAGPNAGPS